MISIDNFGIGRNNKKTREDLMKECNILSVQEFNEELANIKRHYIILVNDKAYYRPSTEIEYELLIEKLNKNIESINRTINIAEKELKYFNEGE